MGGENCVQPSMGERRENNRRSPVLCGDDDGVISFHLLMLPMVSVLTM